MTTIKWSDGEAAWEEALLDYAETLAESDPQSAAELLEGAAGGADEARAAFNVAPAHRVGSGIHAARE
jgi:hypothetical protein